MNRGSTVELAVAVHAAGGYPSLCSWTYNRHSQAMQQAFALELQYLRKLEGAAIASRSIEEMRRVGSFTDAQSQSWLASMREMFPNVSAGERITGINLPGEGVEFWVNGQRVGVGARDLRAGLDVQ